MPSGRLDAEVLDDPNQPLECATCGRALDGDPEDDPLGENGLPMCGLCNRGRNFDAQLEELIEEDDNSW
jgi:hypothetical protein